MLINCINIMPIATYYFATSGFPLPILFPTLVHTDYPNPRPTAYTADVMLNNMTCAAFYITPILVLTNNKIV